jgi:hypothetical protein
VSEEGQYSSNQGDHQGTKSAPPSIARTPFGPTSRVHKGFAIKDFLSTTRVILATNGYYSNFITIVLKGRSDIQEGKV